MDQQPRIDVFLSSTSNDLVEHRAAVRAAIIDRKLHPIMMEDFPAISLDAVDACMAKVDEGKVLVGLYAHRYGYCPNNGPISITEMVYERAKKNGIARLLFVLDKKASFPPDHPINVNGDNDPRLQAFLDRVRQEIVWKTFTTPNDLK